LDVAQQFAVRIGLAQHAEYIASVVERPSVQVS
jgi:hypothetical protein